MNPLFLTYWGNGLVALGLGGYATYSGLSVLPILAVYLGLFALVWGLLVLRALRRDMAANPIREIKGDHHVGQ